MALDVIGAGLGRTGTMTLKTALEQLGFGPCHHMTEVVGNPAQAPLWNAAAEGRPDWDAIYAGYRATVDWPGAAFYAELAQVYPDAKVVLSVRDPGRWYESMAETILKSMQMMFDMAGPAGPEHPMLFGDILIADRTFQRDFSRDNVIAAFERHNAAVKAAIAPDRLLVFQASDGWEPLCAFLGVPVPAEAFPRTNDRAEFWTHAEKARDMAGR
jgi:hypothetical protein